jgi:hypothetical protein
MAFPTVPFIALCGHPKTGKSEVQRIIAETFGYDMIDDKAPLRAAACDLYGLTPWHVETQEGKKQTVDIAGQSLQVRFLLGELGNHMERMHGENVFAEMLVRGRIAAAGGDRTRVRTVIGSCRRRQADVYHREGGLVLEVVRPGYEGTSYEFDSYDPTLADAVIVNDGSLADLEARTRTALDGLLRKAA